MRHTWSHRLLFGLATAIGKLALAIPAGVAGNCTAVITPGYKTDLGGLPLVVFGLSYGAPGRSAGLNLISPWIFDVAQYQYLPPTPANRKLTDIRAQHPHAKIL